MSPVTQPSRSLFAQVRVAMIGRDRRLRELAFDSLGREPVLGGIRFRWLGPVDVAAVHSLAVDAEERVRRLGHAPDTFAIIGLGHTKLVALIPAETNEPRQAARALGLAAA